MVEKDKVGGTCLHRGCIPAKELLETASVFRTVAGAKEFGVLADAPGLDVPAMMSRKQQVVDKLFNGLSGLLKKRKVDVITGTGHARSGHRWSRSPAATAPPSSSPAPTSCWPPGSVPRTIPGFEVDGTRRPHLRRGVRAAGLPAHGSRSSAAGPSAASSRRCSATSAAQVTVLEALPEHPPRRRQRRGAPGAAVLPEARHRRPHGREGHGPHARLVGHHRAPRRRRRRSRSTRSSSRWAAARSPTGLVLRRHRRRGRRRGASWSSTSGAAPGPTGSARWATSSTRPGWRTWASPRRSSWSSRCWASGRAGRLRQGALVHLLPARGRLRRPHRGRGQGGRASTWSSPSTAGAATAGRSSSATPTAW